MQNLVIFKEPKEPKDFACDASCKAGNIFFNRFCIDEDDAFEITRICYLKKPDEIVHGKNFFKNKTKRRRKKKTKGKWNLCKLIKALQLSKFCMLLSVCVTRLNL